MPEFRSKKEEREYYESGQTGDAGERWLEETRAKKDGTYVAPNWTPGTSNASIVKSGGVVKSSTGGGSGSVSGKSAIDEAEESQKDAAEEAEEAARKAARRAYETKVDAANDAKVSAGKNYNWLIDTLGSNKQDLLDQVTSNTNQGVSNYETQKGETTVKYDKAKQEILSTYRDLQTSQEKIMRGAGMSQSSRSMEAQLRLNNLMGKDLGAVSKNEADSLALIGNAITALQNKALETKTSIERETKSKLDKAALDYEDQLAAIDNNLQLSKNEKADAYAAAETQLARDTAQITSWAAGLKLQAEETIGKSKESLDDFIVNMTDEKGLLNASLQEKEAATNEHLTAAGYTTLEESAGYDANSVGTYKKVASKYKSEDEIQEALSSGAITQGQAEQALATLSSGTNTGTKLTTDEDPLLSAIYA